MVFPSPGAVFWAAVSALFQCMFLQPCWQRRFYFFWTGFRGYVWNFFSNSLWLLRPSPAWCFPVQEPCFGLPCLLSCFCNRAGNGASSSFGRVSKETLGSFSALLCGFSVLHWHGVSQLFFAAMLAKSFLAFHCHGVSLSGSHVLGYRVCFSACFFAAVLAMSFLAFGRVSEETLATIPALLFCFLWGLAMSFLALLKALGTFSALLCDFSVLH